MLFSYITRRDQIPALLAAYQEIRIDRATATHLSSRLNQRIFHYEDGPEQEARDESMREAMVYFRSGDDSLANGEHGYEGNANQWADKSKNIAQFSYDAEVEAEKWWAANGSRASDSHAIQ